MPPALAIGVDLVAIRRIEGAVARWGERFLRRVYTDAERAYCRDQVGRLAARFAAKEAVAKALGTGIGQISFQDIEVLPDPLGKPLVHLHRNAQQRAVELGLTHFAISLSHERDTAIAFVVATPSDE